MATASVVSASDISLSVDTNDNCGGRSFEYALIPDAVYQFPFIILNSYRTTAGWRIISLTKKFELILSEGRKQIRSGDVETWRPTNTMHNFIG
uniref:Uncharacterized protein n=1 Tax=Parascaris univalens TaxID=6257 RepID=A0A915CAX1_PARUN